MIKFRFQLNAQYFISIVKLLYIFRALLRHPQEDLCISTTSGSMSVSFGDRAVGRLVRDCTVPQSLTNPPTARSPKETDIEPYVVDIQRSS